MIPPLVTSRLEKLGLRREAELRECDFAAGEWRDRYVYAMLDREWRPV